MKKISIIIPCYNVEKYIERCFYALEEQIFKNFEVIAIDDCSTDNTLKILKELKIKVSFELKIIKNDINRGPAFSRNLGILEANSEFITFCDADDWYNREYLITMMKLIERNKADISFCGYNVINNNNCEARPLNITTEKISLITALTLESDSLCMLVVKSRIIKDTLLPDIRNGEDAAIVPLLMVKSKTIVATSQCMYNYFRNEKSASQQANMDIVNSLIDSYNYTRLNFPKELHKEIEFLGIKNMLYSALITLFSFSYNKNKAKEVLDSFESDFPKWYKNPYLRNLHTYKKVVLKLLRYRMYFCIRIISIIRNHLTSRS